MSVKSVRGPLLDAKRSVYLNELSRCATKSVMILHSSSSKVVRCHVGCFFFCGGAFGEGGSLPFATQAPFPFLFFFFACNFGGMACQDS